MSAWLDALLGRIFYNGVSIPLSKGLNFTGGVKALLNTTTKQIDVTQDLDAIVDHIPDASLTAKGLVELATVAEGEAGADATRALTPASNPRASDTVIGIAERATQAECNALTDQERFVTPGRLPIASVSQRGLVELATAAEANALADTARAVVPATLPIASLTQQGLVELATAAEANALTDAVRAITPATLPITSTGQQGIVRQATSSEVIAASDNALAVSPGRLHRHPGVAKVWSEASGTASTSFADYNLTSVTDAASGVTTFTIGSDFSSSAYAPLATAIGASGADLFAMVRSGQGAGSFVVEVVDAAGASADPAALSVVAYGDQV